MKTASQWLDTLASVVIKGNKEDGMVANLINEVRKAIEQTQPVTPPSDIKFLTSEDGLAVKLVPASVNVICPDLGFQCIAEWAPEFNAYLITRNNRTAHTHTNPLHA